MAQIVEIPGVGEVEFPDEMGDEAVLAAAQKLSAPKARTVGALPLKAQQPIQPTVSGIESGARGGLQGLSAGWGDEGAAGIAALLPFTDREAAKGDTIGERYRNAREFYRHENAQAEQANPGTYGAMEIAGAVAPTLLGGAPATAGRTLTMAAGQGVAQGAGYSTHDGTRLLGDSALGGALGLAGYGAGTLVGKGASAAVRKGADLVRTGTARAAQQGAEAASKSVASLEGAARERAANAYRQMERINLALSDKSLPAQERAALEAFKASPEYADLVAANAKGILAAAPDAAAEREAARQIAAQARAALPAEIQNRTAELLKPQVKSDVKSFLKAYAEPLAWGLGAERVADLAGADPQTRAAAGVIAGAIGGRTRAGKALYTRATRPAHQAAAGRLLERTGQRAGKAAIGLQRHLGPALPAVLMSAPQDEDEVTRALVEALMSAPPR
jgi:hypothetical protein